MLRGAGMAAFEESVHWHSCVRSGARFAGRKFRGLCFHHRQALWVRRQDGQ